MNEGNKVKTASNDKESLSRKEKEKIYKCDFLLLLLHFRFTWSCIGTRIVACHVQKG